MKSRMIILSLCLAGALTLPALALSVTTAEAENAAPIAENLELKTYKGVAISSRFAAVDPEGDLVTFQIVDSPPGARSPWTRTTPPPSGTPPTRAKRARTASPTWPSTSRAICPSPPP